MTATFRTDDDAHPAADNSSAPPRRRADFLSIDGGPDEDPFDTSLVLTSATADHPIAVTLPLTPTNLTELIAALTDIRHAQLEQLGVAPDHTTSRALRADSPSSAKELADKSDDGIDEVDEDVEEGRVKGLFDPLGARHLRGRVTRPALLIGVVLALLAFALVLQILR